MTRRTVSEFVIDRINLIDTYLDEIQPVGHALPDLSYTGDLTCWCYHLMSNFMMLMEFNIPDNKDHALTSKYRDVFASLCSLMAGMRSVVEEHTLNEDECEKCKSTCSNPMWPQLKAMQHVRHVHVLVMSLQGLRNIITTETHLMCHVFEMRPHALSEKISMLSSR